MLPIEQVEDKDAHKHPVLLLARENRKLHRKIFELSRKERDETKTLVPDSGRGVDLVSP